MAVFEYGARKLRRTHPDVALVLLVCVPGDHADSATKTQSGQPWRLDIDVVYNDRLTSLPSP